MCTGRVDLAFIFRAFKKGVDWVFIGGCRPGECHYSTEGNYLALSTVEIAKRLLEYAGIPPERLRLEWISASEGTRFASLMDDFSQALKSHGPVTGDAKMNETRLDVINRLIPYIKLIERERFQVPEKSERAYKEFFSGDNFTRLYKELIEERLYLTEIATLLGKNALTMPEIDDKTGIGLSHVSRYMMSLAGYGIIKYNRDGNSYNLAWPDTMR
jgi:F420-non-reducing hydrogenase iron-sulfur subunit